MVVRVIPLALVIIVGVFFGTQSPDLNPATAFGGESASFIDAVKLISFATFASLWAYEGWTNLNTVAGEMKKPRRDIPLAIILSMGGITLIYTLFNLAIYRIIPANEVNSLIAGGNLYLGTEAVGRILGGVGKWVVLVGMFIGIIGTVNGDCLVFPRTYYAMAKGGFFFKSMGNLNDKGVPANATLASSAMAIVLVCFNSLQSLTDWLITVSALINLLAIIAVLVFRFRFPNMERPYKVWGGVPVIVLTAICFMVLLVNNFVEDPATSLKGLIIIAICVPMYFFFRKLNGGKEYDTDLIDN
jgi:APA family basic amino acid/polyamine antiporter